MRKTYSVSSQTLCGRIQPESLVPWMVLENKAAFPLLQFLGRHEQLSLHAQQISGHGWQLVPREQLSI